MTEREWLEGKDFPAMLRYLHYLRCARKGRRFDPKARLLACAACRSIWDHLTDERSRNAVEVAENHAFGDLNDDAIAHAAESALAAWREAEGRWWAVFGGNQGAKLLARGQAWAASAVVYATGGEGFPMESRRRGNRGTVGSVLLAAQKAAVCVGNATDRSGRQALTRVVGEHARLFREFYGNPFRPSTVAPFSPSRVVAELTRIIYEERSFDRMPILADALEEAGFTDTELLVHCRGPGPHLRGCWALDLLLGKE